MVCAPRRIDNSLKDRTSFSEEIGYWLNMRYISKIGVQIGDIHTFRLKIKNIERCLLNHST